MVEYTGGMGVIVRERETCWGHNGVSWGKGVLLCLQWGVVGEQGSYWGNRGHTGAMMGYTGGNGTILVLDWAILGERGLWWSILEGWDHTGTLMGYTGGMEVTLELGWAILGEWG